MLRILAIAALVLALVVAGVACVALTKPASFSVSRSTTINAPPAAIFPLIDDFHRWGEWSPYEKLDPDMKRSYAGPESGKGAVYEWRGNNAGSGRMEIIDATPASIVTIQLDFTAPFEAHNTAEFTLRPKGDATDVTWEMRGQNNFMAKVMQVFVSMDGLVGKDFETGLANMKSRAEAGSAGRPGAGS